MNSFEETVCPNCGVELIPLLIPLDDAVKMTCDGCGKRYTYWIWDGSLTEDV